jgi:hypothetical protein
MASGGGIEPAAPERVDRRVRKKVHLASPKFVKGGSSTRLDLDA